MSDPDMMYFASGDDEQHANEGGQWTPGQSSAGSGPLEGWYWASPTPKERVQGEAEEEEYAQDRRERVFAAAMLDARPISDKEKRRDASINLYLEESRSAPSYEVLTTQKDEHVPHSPLCSETETREMVWTMNMEPIQASKKQRLSKEAKTKRHAVKQAGGVCPKHKLTKKACPGLHTCTESVEYSDQIERVPQVAPNIGTACFPIDERTDLPSRQDAIKWYYLPDSWLEWWKSVWYLPEGFFLRILEESKAEGLAEDQEIQIDREQEEMQIQFRPPSHRRPVFNYRLPDDCYAIVPEDRISAQIAYAVIVLFEWRPFASVEAARWCVLVLLFAVWPVFHLSLHAGRYADLWGVPKSLFGEGGECLL